MKKVNLIIFLIVAALGLNLFYACQKQQLDKLADSKEYSPLSFETYATSVEEKMDPFAAENFALRLYDFKEDGNGLLQSEVLSLGNPGTNLNLLVALKLVETVTQEEVLWSKEEEEINANLSLENAGVNPVTAEIFDRTSNYQWTGGASQFSLFCSGWKKWPAKYNVLFISACNSFYYSAGYVCRSTLTCSPFPPN